MAKKEVLDPIYHAVIATDAGCRPNPGFMGCGAFGYLYDNNDLGKKTGNKPNKNMITNIGFIEEEIAHRFVEDTGVEEKATKAFSLEMPKEKYKHVTPTHYVHGIYSFLDDSTNNIGEILAFTISIEKLIEAKQTMNIVDALFLIDSEYVIGIFNKINGDEDRTWVPNVKANLVYWEEMYKVLILAKNADINIRVRKIDGHSTALMNHLADRLATMGVFKSTKGEKHEIFTISDAKKYWSPSEERHPFLRFKQLYFIEAKRKQSQPGVYSIMNYPTELEPGRKSAEATFGVVRLSTPQPMLESLMDCYQKNLRTMSIISSLSLDTAFGALNSSMYDVLGDKVYSFNHRRAILNLLDETPIVYAINPPGVANQALDKMIVLNQVIDEYLRRDTAAPICKYIDITDKIYAKDDKGKLTTIITNNDKCMLINIEHDGKKVSIPLQIGKDCIERNNFKQIEGDDPAVYLVLQQTSPKLLSYYILVDMRATNDISVWTNFYSNNKLLK